MNISFITSEAKSFFMSFFTGQLYLLSYELSVLDCLLMLGTDYFTLPTFSVLNVY